ncbi:hypothetical protein HNQ51_002530 [Inhella inkyongensis]|uniref:DUF469 family protein n=1 Tax=Inhella inkyongensis TaxID=392593 RepID=A0A840S9L8_9BURK|nr:50S ribosome-binding protein YggL [Inhella inkyongensis]MBB5205211.1 hypothetical protein [Inhella inkyongensis]
MSTFFLHPPGNAKRRSRRLRKKLHIGEFKELGFWLSATLKDGTSADAEEALMARFIAEVVAPQGLSFGGWWSGGFMSRAGAGSVDEAQRGAVQAWLQQQPELQSADCDALRDAWWGWQP